MQREKIGSDFDYMMTILSEIHKYTHTYWAWNRFSLFSIQKFNETRTHKLLFVQINQRESMCTVKSIICGCFCRNGIYSVASLLVNDAVRIIPLSFTDAWTKFNESLIWHLLWASSVILSIVHRVWKNPPSYIEIMKLFGSLIRSCVAFFGSVIVQKEKFISSLWFKSDLSFWHHLVAMSRENISYDVD